MTDAEALVSHWNSRWPGGTPVRYWLTADGRGRGIEGVTNGWAYLQNGEEVGSDPVARVVGFPAAILLSHVRPLDDEGCTDHPETRRCFECATDEQLARAVPPW